MKQETDLEFRNRKLWKHAYISDSAITKNSKWFSKQFLFLSAKMITHRGYWKAPHIEVAAASKLGWGGWWGECTLHPLFKRSCQFRCYLGEQIKFNIQDTKQILNGPTTNFKNCKCQQVSTSILLGQNEENHCEISFSGMQL